MVLCRISQQTNNPTQHTTGTIGYGEDPWEFGKDRMPFEPADGGAVNVIQNRNCGANLEEYELPEDIATPEIDSVLRLRL